MGYEKHDLERRLREIEIEMRHQQYLTTSARAYLERVEPLSEDYENAIALLDNAFQACNRLLCERLAVVHRLEDLKMQEVN